MLEILNKTYNFAYEYHKNDNSGHDFEHVKRVYANIENLLNEEPSADAFICKMAALLHDVDDHKLNTDGNVARRFLESILSDNYLIEKIIKTIEPISFSKSGVHPVFETLEMKLLSDADKLDAIGAIGICRAVMYGTSHNRNLFDSEEFPCEENNKKHTINHFFEKLLLLKDAMQTNSGRVEAEKRHKFMISFLQRFFEEYGVDDWNKILENYKK